MIKFNYLFFAFFLSILIHIVFVHQIQISKNIDEIYVLDLSSYKEFRASKIEVQKTIPKEIKKPKKKIVQKKIIEKKIEKKIPIKKKQKIEEIKPVQKTEKVEKIEEVKKVQEIKKFRESAEKNTNLNFNQNLQNDSSKKLLVDKKIKSFLIQVSEEINKIAVKSYPIQSIKRREQGTIVVVIVLNSDGNPLEINFENKRPKRLYEKTKQILKSYKFPKPPAIIFEDNQLFRIKIPVKFILK